MQGMERATFGSRPWFFLPLHSRLWLCVDFCGRLAARDLAGRTVSVFSRVPNSLVMLGFVRAGFTCSTPLLLQSFCNRK